MGLLEDYHNLLAKGLEDDVSFGRGFGGIGTKEPTRIPRSNVRASKGRPVATRREIRCSCASQQEAPRGIGGERRGIEDVPQGSGGPDATVNAVVESGLA